MKSLVKKILSSVGLLKAGRVAYSFVKGVSPSVISTEIQVRRHGADGIPVPPQRLIFYVIAFRWAKVFLESGALIVEKMTKQLAESGCPVDACHDILDFGCGCGRLIRHFPSRTKASLYGCDYNGELIGWARQNLQFAEFKQNGLEPPLPYAGDSFDLVYARSVFTHLSEPLQKRWMEELRRVLRPGGCVYFTTHGVQTLGRLSPEERATVESGGVLVQEAKEEGHNVCSSFELEGYVREHLSDGFDFVAYFPGEATMHLQQDGYILRKR